MIPTARPFFLNDSKKTFQYDNSLTCCEMISRRISPNSTAEESKISDTEVQMKKNVRQLSKPFSII